MRIMGHVQADLHFLHGVLVTPVRVLKVEHQLAERPKAQGSVHEVGTATHAQGTVAAIAVNAQYHVMEVVPRELRLKTDGETLHGGQTVG